MQEPKMSPNSNHSIKHTHHIMMDVTVTPTIRWFKGLLGVFSQGFNGAGPYGGTDRMMDG